MLSTRKIKWQGKIGCSDLTFLLKMKLPEPVIFGIVDADENDLGRVWIDKGKVDNFITNTKKTVHNEKIMGSFHQSISILFGN